PFALEERCLNALTCYEARVLARRKLLLRLSLGSGLLACDATLTVLESSDAASSADAGDDGAGADAARTTDGDPADGDAGPADDGWPGPSGTVVEIASGLTGAVDIDVDESFVYVLVGGQDGGLWRVPKRGGNVAPVALHQTFPTSVRSTKAAVVWSV